MGKSYLRDSAQLLEELQQINGAQDYLLATIDVNSLYTSIVQKDGIFSVEKTLHDLTSMKQEQIDFILKGLQLAMTCNYFRY